MIGLGGRQSRLEAIVQGMEQSLGLQAAQAAAGKDDSDRQKKLGEYVYVAFDTETTGLNHMTDRIVELSGVKFRLNGTILDTFSSLIDPQMEIPAQAAAIHGISQDMVTGQPTEDIVLAKFLAWLDAEHDGHPAQTPVLLAHNASFDAGFLESTLGRLGIAYPKNLILDSLALSRRLAPKSPNHQLRTLVEHLGVESGTYHRALDDSHYVRQVFEKLVALLPPDSTLDELARIGGLTSVESPEARQPKQSFIETIEVAIKGKKKLLLEYNGARSSTRTVTPQAVQKVRGSYYLSAFCHDAQAERSFRLDRIVKLDLVES